MEYFKINSLWKRQGWYFDEGKKKSPEYQKGRQSFIIGDYARPEFGNIKRWRVEEKIDGTNIRISYAKKSVVPVMFDGRTEKAQIQCTLLKALEEQFQHNDCYELLGEIFKNTDNVILFGEGYGPKIQAVGANYRSDPGFILFDIAVGPWMLKREDVAEIAEKLGIACAPDLGVMGEDEIVEFVKSKPLSQCSNVPQMMEGVVCRSEPLMLFRDRSPIMWKLKCKEFV